MRKRQFSVLFTVILSVLSAALTGCASMKGKSADMCCTTSAPATQPVQQKKHLLIDVSPPATQPVSKYKIGKHHWYVPVNADHPGEELQEVLNQIHSPEASSIIVPRSVRGTTIGFDVITISVPGMMADDNELYEPLKLTTKPTK